MATNSGAIVSLLGLPCRQIPLNLLRMHFKEDCADIGVSWRWLANRKDSPGAEIVLYDHTPGGAGFVKEGLENWDKVEMNSKRICESCRCEKACYDCLKSYGNQSYHEKLDRLSVLNFLS